MVNFILDKIPNLISIFVFVLILSGNYLGELFPCKVQYMFKNNMFVKHALGFLTLVFFVALTIPEIKEKPNFILNSLLTYFWFLLMSKTYYTLWIVIFGILGIVYLLKLYKENLEDEGIKKQEKKTIQTNNILKKYLIILSVVLTIIGFLMYMGAKKIEYKKKFSYFSFLFGKPSCRGLSPKNPGYLKLLIKAFS